MLQQTNMFKWPTNLARDYNTAMSDLVEFAVVIIFFSGLRMNNNKVYFPKYFLNIFLIMFWTIVIRDWDIEWIKEEGVTNINMTSISVLFWGFTTNKHMLLQTLTGFLDLADAMPGSLGFFDMRP